MRTELIRIETPTHLLDGAHYTCVGLEGKVSKIIKDGLKKTLE